MTSATIIKDPRLSMAKHPMTLFQVSAVGLCFIINILDGFDVLAIAFAAPEIAEEWSLTKRELGFLFSAGLAGMVFSSIVLAGVADYLGRRPTIMLCLAVIAVGMAGSALSSGMTTLCIWRFIVGLGVGTILPSLNTLVAEFSSQKRRELSVTVMQSGFPIGGIVGGIIALIVVSEFGWRGIFWVGSGLSVVVLILVMLYLPESLDFLLSRRPRNALARINAILARMGMSALTEIDVATTGQPSFLGIKALYQASELMRVFCLAMAFFFVMGSFYFVANWTPALLEAAGMARTEGISGGVILSLGGVAGGICLGLLSYRFGVRRLTMLFIVLTVPVMIIFPQMEQLAPMLVVAFVMGYFLLGSMMGLYAATPGLFTAGARTTATGLGVGIGRFGAITGPLIVGYLLDSGWSSAEMYQIFSVFMFTSSIFVFLLHRSVSKNTASTS